MSQIQSPQEKSPNHLTKPGACRRQGLDGMGCWVNSGLAVPHCIQNEAENNKEGKGRREETPCLTIGSWLSSHSGRAGVTKPTGSHEAHCRVKNQKARVFLLIKKANHTCPREKYSASTVCFPNAAGGDGLRAHLPGTWSLSRRSVEIWGPPWFIDVLPGTQAGDARWEPWALAGHLGWLLGSGAAEGQQCDFRGGPRA